MRRPQIKKRSSKRPVRQYVADSHDERKSFAELNSARRACVVPTHTSLLIQIADEYDLWRSAEDRLQVKGEG
jgi:hypothetical protein